MSWKVSKHLHKFSQLCVTRIAVLLVYLVSQMPFVPLFAAALALSDGGHRVQIQQIAGGTEIVLAHELQRVAQNGVDALISYSQGPIVQSHPDHRIHFQQSDQSDLLFQNATVETLAVQGGADDFCQVWCELHIRLLVYNEEWRDLRIRANEQSFSCPEKVQGLASTVMLV